MKNFKYEEGTLVELKQLGSSAPVYGVIKWIGYLPSAESDAKMAGVELEEEMPGATNGWHLGTQVFACPDRKAVFVPFTHFTHDKRFGDGNRSSRHFENYSAAVSSTNAGRASAVTNGFAGSDGTTSSMNGDLGDFGEMDCPAVPGFQPPIRREDVMQFFGRNRGIQGHKNSCYLDATLFAMFSFTR